MSSIAFARSVRPVMAVALCAVLAACQAGDPAEGGFIGGVAGVVGGGYDQRIEERETAVAEAAAERARLEARRSGLEAERAELAGQLAAADARAASLSDRF